MPRVQEISRTDVYIILDDKICLKLDFNTYKYSNIPQQLNSRYTV